MQHGRTTGLASETAWPPVICTSFPFPPLDGTALMQLQGIMAGHREIHFTYPLCFVFFFIFLQTSASLIIKHLVYDSTSSFIFFGIYEIKPRTICLATYTIKYDLRKHIRGGADKSFSPTYLPMSKDGIDSVVGKRGLFMCRIASLFLLQRLKRSMSGDARDFINIETRVVIKIFFFCKARRRRKFTPF